MVFEMHRLGVKYNSKQARREEESFEEVLDCGSFDDFQNCWGKVPTRKAGEGKWLDVTLVNTRKEAATWLVCRYLSARRGKSRPAPVHKVGTYKLQKWVSSPKCGKPNPTLLFLGAVNCEKV